MTAENLVSQLVIDKEQTHDWKTHYGLKELPAPLRKHGAQALRHLPTAISVICISTRSTNEDHLSPSHGDNASAAYHAK